MSAVARWVTRCCGTSRFSHGFTGAVYPVHPTAHTDRERAGLAEVLDVPDDIDVAVLAVPAAEAVKVVEQSTASACAAW